MSRRGISVRRQKIRTEIGQQQEEQTFNLIQSIRRSTSFPEELLRTSYKTHKENGLHQIERENETSNLNTKTFINENRNRMKSSGQFQTALMTLAICDGDVMQLWRLLSRRDVDVNYFDGLGMQPIHYASLYGNIDILKILLQFNIDVNSRTEQGDTALEIAVREGNFEVAQSLINRGATVKDIVNGMRGAQTEKRVEMIRRNSSCDLLPAGSFDEQHDIYEETSYGGKQIRRAIFEI